MNIKSLLAKIRPCREPTKEEKEKELNQIVKDTRADFPED
jgi:hypothetical protein